LFHRKLLNKLLKPALGGSATDSLLAENDAKILKRIARNRRISREMKNGVLHLENAYRASMENLRPVVAPLVLISPPRHSGGHFLNALFDGHPDLDIHPAEWKMGGAKAFNWSALDLDQSPGDLFVALFETDMASYLRNGMTPDEENHESFIFIFLPSLQRDLFLKCLAEQQAGRSLRNVMEAYLTSFFGAWLNYQNSHGAKRYVTALTPPSAAALENAKKFFDTYPDGRLISVIRDPETWWPQAVHKNPSTCPDIETALGSWNQDVQEILRTKDTFGARMSIVRFEDLTGRTEGVMRWLADYLGISFEKSLLSPSFNTIPLGWAAEPPIDRNPSGHKDRNGAREDALSLYRKIPFSAPLS
jgi:hypothetical protein